MRDVGMLDLLPYAVASTYVGTDDMELPAEEGNAHACAGGVIAAMLPDDELAEVAVATGLDPGSTEKLNNAPDRLAFSRAARLVAPPGGAFTYDNRAFELLSSVVEAEAGEGIDALLRRRLFQPLGMSTASWPRGARAQVSTYAGLSMSAMDLAVLGQVLADDGRWNGAKVVPPDWMQQLRWSAAAEREALPGWFSVRDMAGRPGLTHSGSGGQYLFVFPESRLVVVRLARLSPNPADEAAAFPGLENLVAHLAGGKPQR